MLLCLFLNASVEVLVPHQLTSVKMASVAKI